ncbi:MAG: fibronectin type III domain-containing protein [Pyrinomonadaceae bacterium]
MRAFNAGGDSAYSNTALATTQTSPAPPAAPTTLAATAISASQINLSWADKSTNESGFRIERCTGSTCTNYVRIAQLGPNVTTYSNTGLSSKTTYRYRAYAFNAAGNSSYSTPVAKATK